MKYKKIVFVLFFNCFVFTACINGGYGPGYRFDSFKETPLWSLAQAIDNEDTAEIRKLISKGNLDINLKETKSGYGNTLLILAVGRDKLLSVRTLLECGAKQTIEDNMGMEPIHEILALAIPHKHRLEILKLLLQYGADPNKDSRSYLPLAEAVGDLECTKLLLSYGGNLYYHQRDKNINVYGVWSELFILLKERENLLVAKYLIVDRQLPFPDTLFFNSEFQPVTSFRLLNEAKISDPEKQRIRDEIMFFLKAEGYPKHGALPSN